MFFGGNTMLDINEMIELREGLIRILKYTSPGYRDLNGTINSIITVRLETTKLIKYLGEKGLDDN